MSQTNQPQKAPQNQPQPSQTQEAKAAEAEAKAKAKAEAEAKAKAEAKEISKVLESSYERYATLKFIEFDGGKLKEPIKKELSELEESIKKAKAPKAKKTVTAAIGTHTLKMVEGVPMPLSYIEILKNNNVIDIYCE